MKKKNLICFLIVIFSLLQLTYSQNVIKESGGTPIARMYHSLVYDDNAECLVLFPGFVKHGWSIDLITNDLWTFDLMRDEWTYKGLCFSDTEITRQGLTTITYDTESDKYITFDRDGRTLSFDLEDGKWTEMHPETSPIARCGQGLAYDAESDRVIMYGGFGCKAVKDPVYSDTWAYDYNINSWTEMNPAIDPSERMYFAMTYDLGNDKIVLWGGRKLEPITDNKIWAYDYNEDSWVSYAVEKGPSKPLAYPSMIYREKYNDVLIFGGGDLETPFVGKTTNTLWSFSLKKNKWKDISPDERPPKLANQALAYDKLNNRAILFGGELNSLYTSKVSSETWIYYSSKKKWIKNE